MTDKFDEKARAIWERPYMRELMARYGISEITSDALITDIAAALREAAGEWRPIETATRDTFILIYSPTKKWTGAHGVTFGYCHSNFNGHKNVFTMDGPGGVPVEPTHWTPVPHPPSKEEG